jgi:folate-dependent phosphoribosylglycinamide formyltransferase PurN
MISRLAILISGNGSNLQAILDACKSGELPASVVSVVSNKVDSYGLIRAKNAVVEATYFAKLENESRQEYDARLAIYVTTKQPNYIILAGWMRILTSAFLDHFLNRVVNLHPARQTHSQAHMPSNVHIMLINVVKSITQTSWFTLSQMKAWMMVLCLLQKLSLYIQLIRWNHLKNVFMR